MRLHRVLIAMALGIISASAFAQEPVVGVPDPEALFQDKDPVINRNKQATLHIMRELLQCGHWSDAGTWLTERYIQHNPNVVSGLAPVVRFFGSRPRAPTCDKLTTPVVAVLADRDLVAVITARTLRHPIEPGKTYTTSWFDMWRFVDGKADEHWDGAELSPPRPAPPPAAPAN